MQTWDLPSLQRTHKLRRDIDANTREFHQAAINAISEAVRWSFDTSDIIDETTTSITEMIQQLERVRTNLEERRVQPDQEGHTDAS